MAFVSGTSYLIGIETPEKSYTRNSDCFGLLLTFAILLAIIELASVHLVRREAIHLASLSCHFLAEMGFQRDII